MRTIFGSRTRNRWSCSFSSEPKIVRIENQFQFRGNLEVRTCIDQEQTRIHKVGLPFDLARRQVRKDAVAVHQIRSHQAEALPVPEAVRSAGEVGVVEDRVESARLAVLRRAVAGGDANAFSGGQVTDKTPRGVA